MILMMVMMNTLCDFVSGDDHDHTKSIYNAAGAGPLALAPFSPQRSLYFLKTGAWDPYSYSYAHSYVN